jgi:uncharacterized protein
MVKLGRVNTLNILKPSPVGAVLDGGESGNILLTASLQQTFEAGDSVDAFIYLDSEGELAATLEKPLAQVGEVAWLRIVEVNNIGAFVDWGLPKDLFIPYAEQHCELEKGRRILVKVYIDNQNRIAGSTRLDHLILDHIDEENGIQLQEGEQVDLIIGDQTELGYKAIINHQYWGVLYSNEIFKPIKKGEHHTGFIKKIRDDKKIDLSLRKIGYDQKSKDDLGNQILSKLEQHDGFLLFNDKSPPEKIRETFGVSKKEFKKACGALYKSRLIKFENNGITLTN